MRQGELLSLRWENLNWEKRTVFLPMTKNGDPREVPLSRIALDVLKKRLAPKAEGRIFAYTAYGLKSSWRAFIRGIGIDDFHFHDLRHCAISSLLERGLSSIEVATISGHKTMSMLKRYSHLHAYKLVDKLDPKPRVKRERPVLRDHLRPYPARIARFTHRVDVDFLDFVDLCVSGKTEEQAIERAQAKLLRKIVEILCDGFAPPAPSAHDNIIAGDILMISPL